MQIFIKGLTHYILCNPCTVNLCDSQRTEKRNNTLKSHLSAKRKSVSSFTPNSSPCSRKGKREKKPESNLAATWKWIHWKNVPLCRHTWLGWRGKYRTQKCQHVLGVQVIRVCITVSPFCSVFVLGVVWFGGLCLL